VLDRAAAIRAPMLIHVGADDASIPRAQVDVIDATLRSLGVDATQHVYAGAGHAFACDARPAMYRPEAATLAWQRSLELLRQRLVS
jgi:carboxymethylenebutenolidase